jgi:hypothetical protein
VDGIALVLLQPEFLAAMIAALLQRVSGDEYSFAEIAAKDYLLSWGHLPRFLLGESCRSSRQDALTWVVPCGYSHQLCSLVCAYRPESFFGEVEAPEMLHKSLSKR